MLEMWVLICHLCCVKFVSSRGLFSLSLSFSSSSKILGLNIKSKIPNGSLYFKFCSFTLFTRHFYYFLPQPLRGNAREFSNFDFRTKIERLPPGPTWGRADSTCAGTYLQIRIFNENTLDFAIKFLVISSFMKFSLSKVFHVQFSYVSSRKKCAFNSLVS